MVTTDSDNVQASRGGSRSSLTVGAFGSQLPPTLHEDRMAANVGKGMGDSALLGFLFLVGMIPVFVTATHGGHWGNEPTLGLAFAIRRVSTRGE